MLLKKKALSLNPRRKFAMSLALSMGLPDVDALLGAISERQLEEWMAFYELSPWGEERADLRSGMQTAALLNVHVKKGAKPFRALDFMPYAEQPRLAKSNDPAAIRASLRHAANSNRR